MAKPGTSPTGASKGSPPAAGANPSQERQAIFQIIQNGDYATLVERAEQLGRELAAQRLTTSQIRNVFGEVKRLQMRFDANRLRMLKPKLAYMGARAGTGGQKLREVLTSAVDAVFSGNPTEQETLQRFQRMVDFFEAILAYHKAFGGRDR